MLEALLKFKLEKFWDKSLLIKIVEFAVFLLLFCNNGYDNHLMSIFFPS